MVTLRAVSLAASLEEAARALVALIEPITAARWDKVPAPGVWSVGKDVAHVVEAMIYHQWIVRLTIGVKVPSRRPGIERGEMTTRLSARDTVELLRASTTESVALVTGLTDGQLDLPTRPPRAEGLALVNTIERVMIGHIHTHREIVESKLAALDSPRGEGRERRE